MILIVDDNSQIAQFLSLVLGGAGFQVALAGSVGEALSKLESDGPFRLLLSDLGLPDGSGLDLSQQAREKQPELKVLLMSGYDVDAPGLNFILKPFDPTVLVDKVRALLE